MTLYIYILVDINKYCLKHFIFCKKKIPACLKLKTKGLSIGNIDQNIISIAVYNIKICKNTCILHSYISVFSNPCNDTRDHVYILHYKL